MKYFIYYVLFLLITSNSAYSFKPNNSKNQNDDYISENQLKIDILSYDLFIDLDIKEKTITAEISIVGTNS